MAVAVVQMLGLRLGGMGLPNGQLVRTSLLGSDSVGFVGWSFLGQSAVRSGW